MSTAHTPEPTQSQPQTSGTQAAEFTPRDAANWAKQGLPAAARRSTPEAATERHRPPSHGPGAGLRRDVAEDLHASNSGTSVTPRRSRSPPGRPSSAASGPKGNFFYGALTGIAPGDVALLDLSCRRRCRLSTGDHGAVRRRGVVHADDAAGAHVRRLDHLSAARGGDSVTAVQTQVLLRANDPLYELAMPLLLNRREDRFWQQTLTNLAVHLGVAAPVVTTSAVCVDRRRQWRHAGNVWHNAGIRSALHALGTPLRSLRLSRRRSERHPPGQAGSPGTPS